MSLNDLELSPPLQERTDKELLGIISNDKKWRSEIQESAYQELKRRGLSEEKIEREREKRQKILFAYQQRKQKIKKENQTKSYTISEMIFVVLFFPLNFLSFPIVRLGFAELYRDNFKKKIWQRVLLILVSIGFWLFVLYLIYAI